MYKELENKVAVVTGGSKGIGTAIAQRFGKEKMNVVVNYNSDKEGAEKAVKAIEEAGGKAVSVQADVSSEEGIQRLLDTALENFGTLDIWVNNAGMENQHPTHELSLEDWERVLKVNLTGVFIGTKAALNYFTENDKKEISSICLLFMNKSMANICSLRCFKRRGKIIYRNGSNGVRT